MTYYLLAFRQLMRDRILDSYWDKMILTLKYGNLPGTRRMTTIKHVASNAS